MTTVNYEKLDSLIVGYISENRNSPLYEPEVRTEARRLEEEHGGEDFRYIDRRLQALRKKGMIRYLKRAEAPNYKCGWYTTKHLEDIGWKG